MAIFEGYNEPHDEPGENPRRYLVLRDGCALELKPSLGVSNHSPTGFSWGYAGSGPAQLALALLMEVMPWRTAAQLYQSFKFDVVARWPSEPQEEPCWTITSDELLAWAYRRAAAAKAEA